MTVTIKTVEDAILAALAADPTITAWGGSILSGDDAAAEIGRRAMRYPALIVAYAGADGGAMAGGTGAGLQFKRSGEFQIYCLEKNYRGANEGRRGDPAAGAY